MTVSISITLDDELGEELNPAVAGSNRSAFVADAIRDYLDQRAVAAAAWHASLEGEDGRSIRRVQRRVVGQAAPPTRGDVVDYSVRVVPWLIWFDAAKTAKRLVLRQEVVVLHARGGRPNLSVVA